MDPVKAYLSSIGAKGGRVKSKKRAAASRRNAAKARAALAAARRKGKVKR